MRTKQTIAIIGASGKMGSAIATALSSGTDRLLLCGNVAKTQPLADKIRADHPAADVEALGCATNASWEADIIILAVPYGAEKDIAGKIREVANQKIVVSISNPFNEKFDGLRTEPAASAAEELQQRLPNSKVVKAFNTVFAETLGATCIAGIKVDSFIAGNDAEALETVSELVRTAGLNPRIAGDLPVSRITESMALLLIRMSSINSFQGLPGWKILHD